MPPPPTACSPYKLEAAGTLGLQACLGFMNFREEVFKKASKLPNPQATQLEEELVLLFEV
eukprot:3642544-Pyramimonas_sp.AAC.1